MSSLTSSDEDQKKVQKKKRGRPAKVLTSEEFLALQNKPKRGRGRPKKELTEEEKIQKALSRERGKGRPKKKTTPQEDWLLLHAPKKKKGRPKKDDILPESLPRIFAGSEQDIVRQALDLQKTAIPQVEKKTAEKPGKKEIKKEIKKVDLDREIDSVIQKIKNREEERQLVGHKKQMPQMPWSEFKQKMKITDCFVEDYVFPFSEKELHQEVQEVADHVQEEIKEKSRLSVFSYDEPSSYVLDLRQVSHRRDTSQSSGHQDKEYSWEQKAEPAASDQDRQKADFLRFDLPEDSFDQKIVYTKPKKEKIKTAKVNFISQDQQSTPQTKTRTKKASKSDTFLVVLGKFLCRVWDFIVYPFRVLNFLLDTFLLAIISLFSFIFKGLWGLLRGNASFLAAAFSRREVAAVAVSPAPRATRKRAKPALIFSLVCLLVVLPFAGVSFLNKVNQTRGDVLGVSTDGIRYLTEAGGALSTKDTSQTLKYFSSAKDSFDQAESQIDDLGVVASFFGQLVPEIKDGRKLIEAGSLVSEIGSELARGMALFKDSEANSGECMALPGAEAECFSLQKMDLTDKLSYIKNIFASQSGNIDSLIENIDSVDVQSLPSEYRSQFMTLKENIQDLKYIVSELGDFFDFSLEFLGHDGAQRYLVIFQNTSEARATGGFMGSFALVDVYQGNVRQMEIPGGGFYDLKSSNQTTVEAPKPLQVSSPVWQIWNANWFADFPASAEKIIWFYENLTDSSSVDGVITLTEDVVVDMLGFTGEITMDEYGKTFDQDNFVSELQKSVEIEYDAVENKPKKIIADMTPLLLGKIFDLDQGDFLQFLTSFSRSIEQEKVLFYFKDDSMQNLVEDMGWSGEIQKTHANQDYLSVVHTNISGGKTDNVIKNKIRHSVYPQDDGSLLAQVELTRSHLGDENLIFENDNNVDYVRFYVPESSEFISAEGFNFQPGYLFDHNLTETNVQPDEQLTAIETDIKIDEPSNTRISREFDKTVFGNWIQVAPGQERTVSITYKLPFAFESQNKKTGLAKWLSFFRQDDTGEKYVLIVDKQLGRGAEDFVSTLHLPAGQSVVENITGGGKLEKHHQEINFVSSLEKDGFYGIVFE